MSLSKESHPDLDLVPKRWISENVEMPINQPLVEVRSLHVKIDIYRNSSEKVIEMARNLTLSHTHCGNYFMLNQFHDIVKKLCLDIGINLDVTEFVSFSRNIIARRQNDVCLVYIGEETKDCILRINGKPQVGNKNVFIVRKETEYDLKADFLVFNIMSLGYFHPILTVVKKDNKKYVGFFNYSTPEKTQNVMYIFPRGYKILVVKGDDGLWYRDEAYNQTRKGMVISEEFSLDKVFLLNDASNEEKVQEFYLWEG